MAYPTLVEPLFPVSRQAALWSAAYAAFAIVCTWLALGVARAGSHASPTPGTGTDERRVPSPSGSDVGLWLALSACGSGLLIAVTNHITMDVAVVPFLWVLPLSLYLLTFVFAFAGLYRRSLWGSLLVLGLGAMALLWNWGFALPFAVQFMGSAAVLFTACMVCHGELARSAPGAPHLTTFYLTIAAGGALGGLLVALLAPAVFSDFWELPLFLLASYALLVVVIHRDRRAVPEAVTLPLSSAALVSVLVIASAGFVLPTVRRDRGTVATARNFYGVLRVQGEFKRLSQHLKKEEELRWRQPGADGRIELYVRRCVHPVVPRWDAGSIGRGSGRKSLAVCRARKRPWPLACLPLSGRAGFANVGACHLSISVPCRGVIYRS